MIVLDLIILLHSAQAFFTATALEQIARTTLQNAADFATNTVKQPNEVKAQVQADLRASLKKVRVYRCVVCVVPHCIS